MAQQLRPAEHQLLLGRGIAVDHPAGGIAHHHAIGQGRQQRIGAQLLVGVLGFGLLPGHLGRPQVATGSHDCGLTG